MCFLIIGNVKKAIMTIITQSSSFRSFFFAKTQSENSHSERFFIYWTINMKKNIIRIIIAVILLVSWWVLYKRYMDHSSDTIQKQTTTWSTTTTKEEDKSYVATWITYQWEWVKDVTSTSFDKAESWEEVATWLTVPREIAFRSDNKMYITERPWNILLYDMKTKQRTIWTHIDVSQQASSEKWLLWLTVDPKNDDIVYVAYTYQSQGKFVNTLAKIDHTTWAEKITKLIDGVAANWDHDGGRVKIGPDGKLYRTMGDAENSDNAQNTASLNGKILRSNLDWSIPSDNPIKGSYVYSYWHRNPQWLAWQPGTNLLWSSEHGPSKIADCCRDELNIIQAGKNYWRPIIRGSQDKDNMQEPVRISSETTTWAPWWMTFITQWDWKNSLLVAWLKWESIYRVVFDSWSPTKITTVERHLHSIFWRLRNVVEHDGYIYIMTSNRDGRQKWTINATDDKVLRMKE